MAHDDPEQATSTELTGGAGFTYEDKIVAYYLAALLRGETAAGVEGVVSSVAVQRAGHDVPMDDIVVESRTAAERHILSLQVKRSLRITTVQSNSGFREILAAAKATRDGATFDPDNDRYGFVVENVAVKPFRSLSRLIEWAKASPESSDYIRRFAEGGSAAEPERAMGQDIANFIEAKTPRDEVAFLRNFVALKIDGLDDLGFAHAELVNRLQEIVSSDVDGLNLALFDRLCRLARESAGIAAKWTRPTLLRQLRGRVRLRTIPDYSADIAKLSALSAASLAEIEDDIGQSRIDRPNLQETLRSRLEKHRLVNINGLPGCGKSVVLKQFASTLLLSGPVLFLKSDRLEGTGWLGFADKMGLRHTASELLSEIGATGTPILLIDGIDRIRPDHKAIITDILRAIESEDSLSNWKVLATSRDQGLEPYRAWFPASFYRETGVADVNVGTFSDEEADALATEIPSLRPLLFGNPRVREIARRPFFAAVLAATAEGQHGTPQTETDLIDSWWSRAGHNAVSDSHIPRQRALLDLAEAGARNLGKRIPSRRLKDATFAQISELLGDHILRTNDGGAHYSFSHDIFFEWAYYRLLVELDDDWISAIRQAGEPPLLGRVVGLLAQSKLNTPGVWQSNYQRLNEPGLRPQWRREWLTAPPFSTSFGSNIAEFSSFVLANDGELLEKLLVWFQAQHTVPNASILRRADVALDNLDQIRLADMLGWPSDFRSWGRLLDWLMSVTSGLPARLVPSIVEIYGVWQNALVNIPNDRSAEIVDQCAQWLERLDSFNSNLSFDDRDPYWRPIGREGRSALATSLRAIILRAAVTYPDPAKALFERAITDESMRREAYSDLMAFTPTMAQVAPDLVVSLAKVELMTELPKESFERQLHEQEEHLEALRRARATPEVARTDFDKRMLDTSYSMLGVDKPDLEEVGLDRRHSYYYPASALHEPFSSLLERAPSYGLGLIRDLANRAVLGWRQIHEMNPRMGTPIPMILEMKDGPREFWGDWYVYSWGQGQLAPQPLECAYLALSYWAFKAIDSGQPTDGIIETMLEGHQSYATLGLALTVALETFDVSEITLPIAACQKMWHHDIQRLVKESTKDIDLFGFGFLEKLSGAKAEAKKFLDNRRYRGRDIRQLAFHFALSANDELANRFRQRLELFPDQLPFDYVEQLDDLDVAQELAEQANLWKGLGDRNNYRSEPAGGNQVMITYEQPTPISPEQKQKAQSAQQFLHEQSAYAWAAKSLVERKPAEGWSMAAAVEFAKSRDTPTLFDIRNDAGGHAVQSAIAAIANCVIIFGNATSEDALWAWDVMARVEEMEEPGEYHGSKIPWHPSFRLIVALAHDRASTTPKALSLRRLFLLTSHPNDDVMVLAFTALFRDPDESARWVAAHLAIEYAQYHAPTYRDDGSVDNSAHRTARADALSKALDRLSSPFAAPLPELPPAWTNEVPRKGRWRRAVSDSGWGNSDPSFEPQFAALIFKFFPIEAWCSSPVYGNLASTGLKQLIDWTAERAMPSWAEPLDRSHRQSNLIEWNAVLADLVARSTPYLPEAWIRDHLLAPFLVESDECLDLLANFADRMVCRFVFDAATIPSTTIPLLRDCLKRVVADSAFEGRGRRAGEIYGRDMPQLIKALLMVNFEGDAPGSARFVNGDWSQIDVMMPIVSELVSQVGWSTYVAQSFLSLCERVGDIYPIDEFSSQANAMLAEVAKAKGAWNGTTLPSRIARVIQKLSEKNYPLRQDQAKDLLKALDSLIDLGDRRSAALEQTEAFRDIQLLAA